MSSSLPPDQVEVLMPLLASLARLVDGDGSVGDQELEMLLLLNPVVDQVAVMDELRKWVQLLSGVYKSPTELTCRVAAEALIGRGLPEAPVLLAVATIKNRCEQGTAITSTSSTLTLSTSNLDFGTLASDAVGRSSFTVSGGPGRIMCDSSNIRITPSEFGIEPTTVDVQVRPPRGGMLFASLEVISHNESVTLPVAACWENQGTEPTDEQARRPSVTAPAVARSENQEAGTVDERAMSALNGGTAGRTISVYADGRGDYKSVKKAVRASLPGDTIHLGPGAHKLPWGLTIPHGICLEGEGIGATVVIAKSDEILDPVGLNPALRFNSQEGMFVLRNLTVRGGSYGISAMGHVDVELCQFEGQAVASVYLYSNASGQVVSCIAKEGRHGFLVIDASVALRSNQCMQQSEGGILVAGASKVNAFGNQCLGAVQGIEYQGTSAGIIQSNRCIGAEYGISIAEDAVPAVVDNVCEGNGKVGIAHIGRLSTDIRGNICKEYNLHGIWCTGESDGTIESNTCMSNLDCGICVQEKSKVTIANNRCEGNKYGIYVSTTASAKVLDNEVHGNAERGFWDKRIDDFPAL